MKRYNWHLTAALLAIALNCAIAAPSERNDADDGALDDVAFELNPVDSKELFVSELDRDKRSQDVGFGTKNAVIGFVFGKIDNFLDAKTRFINTLDQTNIAKNKQHNIVAPAPINSLQSLIQAIITPKITAITSTIGGLSGSLGGVLGGSSGGGGGTDGGNSASGGLGGIVTSFLRLSGPILSSSSGGAGGGGGGASISASATIGDSTDATTEEETPY